MLDRLREIVDSHRRPLAIGAAVLALAIAGATRGGGIDGAGPFPEPVQTPLDEPLPLAAPDGFAIEATDEYEVEAVVLSRRRYRFDAGAAIAPVDLLLGWGPVAVEPAVNAIKWSQGDRWGYWRWGSEGPPSSVGDIADHCANTHIVPDFSSTWMRRELLSLDRGDHVRLGGYLVEIRGDNGWKWDSSRSRTDRGDGSCEVFYVTSCEVMDP